MYIPIFSSVMCGELLVHTSLVPFLYTQILSVLSVWFKLGQLVQMCVHV